CGGPITSAIAETDNTCSASTGSACPVADRLSPRRDFGPQPMGRSLGPPCLQRFDTEVTEMLRALRTTKSELRLEARRFFRLPLATPGQFGCGLAALG